MGNTTDFETARAQAQAQADAQEQMSEQEQQPNEQQGEPIEEQVTEPVQEQQQDVTPPAPVEPQAPTQPSPELAQIMQQMQDMQAQNQQLQSTIQQMSQQQEQAIVEEAMKPPELDFAELAYDDEATVAQKKANYDSQMLDYTKAQMMKELSPVIEQVKQTQAQSEKQAAIQGLAQVPELAGIADMVPHLDNIIAKNPGLQSQDVTDRYVTAYMIAKGAEAINTPPQATVQPQAPTPEQIAEMYTNNPEVQQAIEKLRLEKIKPSQQVPTFTATAGAANAALNIPTKPKDFGEVREMLNNMKFN